MPSRKLLIGHRISLAFALPCLILLFAGFLSLRNLANIRTSWGWVDHTIDVLAQVHGFDGAFSRLGADGRGYLLTGDIAIKRDLEDQRRQAANHLFRIEALTVDNPREQNRMSEAGRLLADRAHDSEELVALRDGGGGAANLDALSLIRDGERRSSELHRILSAMEAEETGLLARREADASHEMTFTRYSIFAGTIAAFIVVAAAGWLLRRGITGPLDGLGRAAMRIGQGDYAHRAPITRQDETGRLAALFNIMAAQVQDRQEVLATQAVQLGKSEAQLKEQQEELRRANEELEQSIEELRQLNEELEENAHQLAAQKKELEQKSRELEVSSRYKSEFLATMSHELRTPLNSLLILSRILAENREGNLTAKQVQYAKTVESSGEDLLEMINQVLDLAKVESGKTELEVEYLSLADLRESLDRQFRHVADSRRLQYEVTLVPGAPAGLRTDIRRLNQILKNLLSNAFKFTEKGSVRMEIRLADAPLAVAIAVADSGIGIPRDKQALIFESFRQADAGTARRYGGTGLGLSISRDLAALLGGGLRLESEPGIGSTFTLVLPAEPAKVPPPSDGAPAGGALGNTAGSDQKPDHILGGRRIFIVDDDIRNVFALTAALEGYGMQVRFAESAQAAIASLEFDPKADAILMDVMMPGMDGNEAIRRLRSDARFASLPIITVTAKAMKGDRQRSVDAGASDYITKPIDLDKLVSLLRVWLYR